MLELVLIFLVTLLVASSAIWVYRKISGWGGFTSNLVGRPGITTIMQIRAQQGYIRFLEPRHTMVRTVRLRSPRWGFKSPWGW